RERAGEAPQALAAPIAIRTYIHPRATAGRFYVACGRDEVLGMECDASWEDPDLGLWALRLDPRTWAAGTESIRSAHYYAYARRRAVRLWRVASLGTVRFHSPGRWDIFKRK